MIFITFEHHGDEFPGVTEGPFEWIEVIGSSMAGMRPGGKEADEFAGVNLDSTWDAGPFEADEKGNRKRRAYTRWTISQAGPKEDSHSQEFSVTL